MIRTHVIEMKMFTGIVQKIGIVENFHKNVEGMEIIVENSEIIVDLSLGDSVSINGVCQTVTKIKTRSFHVQAVHSTLSKTTLGRLVRNEAVNLELALRPMDRMGGHFVQGHINAIGKVDKVSNVGKNIELTISFPEHIRKYLVKEGSLAVDGVSLTISDLDHASRTVKLSIIPHTWEFSVLHLRRPGSLVNIEVDILAKYVENFLHFVENSTGYCGKSEENCGKSDQNCGFTLNDLLAKGF